MKIKIIAFASMLFSFAAVGSQCNKDNFDQCKTCDELSKAVDIKQPDSGDYFRGALWNGLYASYVRNCPAVAEKLLSGGASASLGGPRGSMGAAIVGKWPHDEESVNMFWAEMLIKHGFGVSDYNGDYQSAIEYWAANPDSIEYKSVWRKLVSSSEQKPLEPERNIEWCAGDEYGSVVSRSLVACVGNAIARLDDGISPASEIASVAINSCRDEVKKSIAGISCQMAMAEQSDLERKKRFLYFYNDEKSNVDIISIFKEKAMEQVLESRAKSKRT
jgi:hypothetical protein